MSHYLCSLQFHPRHGRLDLLQSHVHAPTGLGVEPCLGQKTNPFTGVHKCCGCVREASCVGALMLGVVANAKYVADLRVY